VAVSEDLDPETVAAVLGDETARAILTATSVEPMSASELGDHCDVDTSTAYRWTERLRDAGLLAERTRPREDGHHDAVYVATLAELSVRLDEGDLEVEMTTDGTEDRADRLTSMWEEL
jgi:DNA-binding transcriptional ArsR family regulator